VIIPLSADLRLGRMPWVTWAVILLCIIVFAFQFQSNAKYSIALGLYCQYANSQANKYPNDFIRNYPDACTSILDEYHRATLRGEEISALDANYREHIEQWNARINVDRAMGDIHHHVEGFNNYAPALLDEKLMYFPDSYNPLTMITSSLAHGGWLHIIFNLIFFFAFAPAVELLIGSAWRFTLSLLGIAVVCSLSYSLFSLGSSDNIPTLGLSGVVTGVIGLSAFLMPRARINTLIWFIVPLYRIPIPAWILAIWFIGWDAWDLLSEGMNHGVNLVAHVSGGVAGYLIGRWFFKARKEEIQDELDEEIAHMEAQHSAGFSIGNTATMYRNMKVLEEQAEQDRQRKEQGAFMDKLYNLVRTEQDSEALNLILADTDPLRLQTEEFEELFEKTGNWMQRRTYLCIGRLLVDLYVRQHRYGDAFRIIKSCLGVTRDFVLADPRHVLLLAHEANRQQLYKLAVALLHNAEQRYTPAVDYLQCGLLEVDILSNHLDAVPLARQRLMALKKIVAPADQESLDNLAAHLG
jgi:membrane associated rhomboid family serine protease